MEPKRIKQNIKWKFVIKIKMLKNAFAKLKTSPSVLINFILKKEWKTPFLNECIKELYHLIFQ